MRHTTTAQALCEHGEPANLCHDAFTPAQHTTVRALANGAYTFAVSNGLHRDDAEQFAVSVERDLRRAIYGTDEHEVTEGSAFDINYASALRDYLAAND